LRLPELRLVLGQHRVDALEEGAVLRVRGHGGGPNDPLRHVGKSFSSSPVHSSPASARVSIAHAHASDAAFRDPTVRTRGPDAPWDDPAMPIVCVHGVPDTPALWNPLRARLGDREVITPALPGFGVDAPAGFGGTRDAYAEWLVATIEAIGAPVDLEGLAHDPAQQAASQYMNWLRAPGSEQALAADGFRVAERLMLGMGENPGWFDADARARYHACWSRGLRGGVNYYRASRVHPPTDTDAGAAGLALDPAAFRVPVPVRVLWGEQDRAMLPTLLDPLDRFVDDLVVTRVADASHWIVHEQPERVNRWIAESLYN